MTTAGSQAVNPMSAGQHMNSMGSGVAPSAGDPTRYLGPDPGSLQVNSYDRVNQTNYDYPEAVKNQQLHVRSSIEGFLFENIEFYTTLVLPWAQTNQMTIVWDEWHFNKHLADRVPHEGVSRLITSSKRQFKTHVVRRGLAFIQEADYAETPEGKEHYNRNVASIAQSVQETQNHDTIFAILHSKTYYKMWMQRFGTMSMSYNQIINNEKATHGSVCLPSGDDRMAVVIEDHMRLLSKEGITPNILILWPGAKIYMSTAAPPLRTEFWRAGSDGQARREQGPTSMSSYHGIPVFEARDFTVYEDGPAVQLLTRPVQVSEYYAMRFDRRYEDVSDFQSRDRGIVIYDENVNQWKKISHLEMFNHSHMFEQSGDYNRRLHDLIQKYNARDQKPYGENGDSDLNGEDTKPTFFLTAPDNEGEWMLLRYFGQMEMHHMTATDVQRIGETICAKMGNVNMGAWSDFMGLVNDIEKQPYNHDYWAAVAGANTANSLASNGTFVGEETPDDLVDAWGLRHKQRQWASNAHGSLNLPNGNAVRGMRFPSGFANGPGLRTLADEAEDRNSPWYEAGLRARNAITVMEILIGTLQNRLPSSAALDAKSRAPWFHRDDALSTFFSTVVGVSRDPLFMLSLPAEDVGDLSDATSLRRRNRSRSTAPKKNVKSKGAKWFTVPGYVLSLDEDEVLETSRRDAIRDLKRAVRDGDFVDADNDPDTTYVIRKDVSGLDPDDDSEVLFYSPTFGGVVSVPIRDFGVWRLAPEIRAFGMMPAGNSGAAKDARNAYFNVMRSVKSADVRRQFTEFVFNVGSLGGTRMWRAVDAMGDLDATTLTNTINAIHLTDKATGAQKQAMAKRMRELTATGRHSDKEFEGLKPLRDVWASFGTQPASIDDVGQQQVADDVQRIFNIADALAEISDADFSDSDTLKDMADAAGDATAKDDDDEDDVADLVEEMEDLVDRVTRAGGLRIPASESRDVDVLDTPRGVASGAYYRTPLTSSIGLVQSLSRTFGGSGFSAKPMVLPSDPGQAHTAPFISDDEDNPRIPGSVLRRGSYRRLSEAYNAVRSASNYADMDSINRDGRLRDLDSTPFIQRHLQMNASATAASADSSAASTDLYDDEDIDSDAEDDVAAVFAGAPASASMKSAKRQRSSAALIGSHGGYHDKDFSTHHVGEYKVTRTGALAARWQQANDIANPLVRACAHAFLLTKCDHASVWRRMIENNILLPIDMIAWRPFIVHDMASGILMKGGIETGANLHGGANVTKVGDGISKLIHYNFTFRSKAVVFREKNIIIMENLKFEGYIGGLNGEFVLRREDLDREDRDRPSIIVTVIPINEPSLPQMLDFSGQLNIPQANLHIDGPLKNLYSSAEFYELVWNLTSRTSSKSPMSEDFNDRADRVSIAAFQGTQFDFNRNSGKYNRFVEPQSYLKRNMCYPGAAEVLDGTAKSFIEYPYEQVNIE